MKKLLKNGFVLDTKGMLVKIDILIEYDKITKMSEEIVAKNDYTVIDVTGKLVIPGLVDLHVHLREPGGEAKETIETGTLAAAKGGFTTIAPMPNTNPVPDNEETMRNLHARIHEKAHVRVLPYAAISVNEKGEELINFAELKNAGAFAFSDDGVGVQNAAMMFEAMKEAAALNMSVVAHCEENSLIFNGAVHDGTFAKKNDIPGIPSICESVHIARDVLLAEAANCHYHVCHISTKESVRVVRDAKRAGINVTAEVSPHHLILCEDDIPEVNTNYKMNPPLRSREDRAALLEGLLDGTIDFIATDHAPHTAEEKAKNICEAPFGIVGLETAFPLLYTHFVKKEIISMKQLVDFLTKIPCEKFQLPYGELAVGKVADITVIDLEEEREINPNDFASKGRNTPFAGWKCQGWPILTIASGNIAWEKESVNA
ncbi:dihydroorotase [Lottiidibacillus patelloidae]|uniref:Dihydroorotase n=1 Tax=Lottiidibacillus patelloidae TaxID=2670334 RepID=A0A263BZD3_9BACI|nr:dihydroorotase [Lottiidibacillus patelloidae]OZM58526.1 dihydroorotase [Lottiidibacillus patelloidae]